MNILAIESASTVCGTALFLNDQMVEMNEVTKPRVHGERLPVVINNILKKNDIKVDDLDGIAVSEGPGSYTGLRIGMSLAKGMAVTMGIPIVPIPTLEVMNKGAARKGEYWVLLHSHKNIVYAQRFNSGIPESEIECKEFDLEQYSHPLGFNLDAICESRKYESAPPSSKNVAELAIQHFNKWAALDINTITPNYVTNFNIGNILAH